MFIIIVSQHGILDTPILVKHPITAEATVHSIAEELLGEDWDEINTMSDDYLLSINKLLKYRNVELHFFETTVNKYKNK